MWVNYDAHRFNNYLNKKKSQIKTKKKRNEIKKEREREEAEETQHIKANMYQRKE